MTNPFNPDWRSLREHTTPQWFRDVSDVSAHGTVLRDCVVECLRFIFTPIGVEDDAETRDDEGACRAGR